MPFSFQTLYEQVSMYAEYIGYNKDTDIEEFHYTDAPIKVKVHWNRVKHTIEKITFTKENR